MALMYKVVKRKEGKEGGLAPAPPPEKKIKTEDGAVVAPSSAADAPRDPPPAAFVGDKRPAEQEIP